MVTWYIFFFKIITAVRLMNVYHLIWLQWFSLWQLLRPTVFTINIVNCYYQIMLYITHSDLIDCIAGNFSLLATFTHFPTSTAPTSGNTKLFSEFMILESAYKCDHTVHLSDLISLSIEPLRVHICCCKWQGFLFIAKQYSILYIHHIFFIHSFINGHRLTPCLDYCE